MERWAPAPARERPRRRAGQPSFSSSLLDAICDSLDEQPGGASGTAAARSAGSGGDKKQQQETAAALHCYYYYKPSLAASHRAAPPPPPAEDCSVRGYFSSSEIEHSLRRLRPIRTSAAGAASVAPADKNHQPPPPATTGKARKPSTASARGGGGGGCRRPASPGARLASLINAIFSGKRHSARQHPAPPDDELAAPSTARPCLAKTPPPSTRAARPRASRSRSTSRTVRFLDIDGEVAVAAAAAGCRRVPVVEVEEDTDVGGGEESSDASSDLFELENLAAAIAPGSGGVRCRRACGDELPVYGTTTGAGLRPDIGRRRRPFGYGSHDHGRSCSRVV
ncbi:unnamed protein product [Urochloa humidicola]